MSASSVTAQERETGADCFDITHLSPKVAVHLQAINSRAISLPKPHYPDAAKSEKISGEVIVLVIIDERGRVDWARIHKGNSLLVDAVKEVACRARFRRLKISGRAVKYYGVLTYRFRLP